MHNKGSSGQDDRPWDDDRESLTVRATMPSGYWDQLVKNATVAHARAGGVISRSGEPPRIAALLTGVAREFTGTPDGRQVTLRYARPGDLIGLTALLSGVDTSGAEAVTDATLAMLTLENLRRAAAEHDDFCWTMAELTAAWAAQAVSTVLDAGSQPMAVRVARHLGEIAVRDPDQRTVAHVTHQRLADAVGTAREVITRVLREFRRLGVITTRPGSIVIADLDRLLDIAQGLGSDMVSGRPRRDRGHQHGDRGR
jgi:CRP/FNR family cyclic AMP-dependent transcriptional regulator